MPRRVGPVKAGNTPGPVG